MSFPEEIESGLINVYSRYGVREIPKPRNLLELIGEIARYTFLRKPAATSLKIDLVFLMFILPFGLLTSM